MKLPGEGSQACAVALQSCMSSVHKALLTNIS